MNRPHSTGWLRGCSGMQQFLLAQNDVYGHENGYRKVG